MTVQARCIREAKYAENAQTTQYTAPAGTRTIIDKFTATNDSGSAVVLAVNLVPNGSSAGADNLIVEKSVPNGETLSLSELAGHVLQPGDLISTIAATASAIVIRISGREVT